MMGTGPIGTSERVNPQKRLFHRERRLIWLRPGLSLVQVAALAANLTNSRWNAARKQLRFLPQRQSVGQSLSPTPSRLAAPPSSWMRDIDRVAATDSFIRAVRVFLSGPVGSSAFQEVSLGREVSVVFTSNGPLIYRWEGNNSNNGRPRTVNAYQTFYNVAQRGKPENRLPIMATNSIQSADR
jgi:hypothetical protein